MGKRGLQAEACLPVSNLTCNAILNEQRRETASSLFCSWLSHFALCRGI